MNLQPLDEFQPFVRQSRELGDLGALGRRLFLHIFDERQPFVRQLRQFGDLGLLGRRLHLHTLDEGEPFVCQLRELGDLGVLGRGLDLPVLDERQPFVRQFRKPDGLGFFRGGSDLQILDERQPFVRQSRELGDLGVPRRDLSLIIPEQRQPFACQIRKLDGFGVLRRDQRQPLVCQLREFGDLGVLGRDLRLIIPDQRQPFVCRLGQLDGLGFLRGPGEIQRVHIPEQIGCRRRSFPFAEENELRRPEREVDFDVGEETAFGEKTAPIRQRMHVDVRLFVPVAGGGRKQDRIREFGQRRDGGRRVALRDMFEDLDAGHEIVPGGKSFRQIEFRQHRLSAVLSAGVDDLAQRIFRRIHAKGVDADPSEARDEVSARAADVEHAPGHQYPLQIFGQNPVYCRIYRIVDIVLRPEMRPVILFGIALALFHVRISPC